jgi:hypothetical protein
MYFNPSVTIKKTNDFFFTEPEFNYSKKNIITKQIKNLISEEDIKKVYNYKYKQLNRITDIEDYFFKKIQYPRRKRRRRYRRRRLKQHVFLKSIITRLHLKMPNNIDNILPIRFKKKTEGFYNVIPSFKYLIIRKRAYPRIKQNKYIYKAFLRGKRIIHIENPSLLNHSLLLLENNNFENKEKKMNNKFFLTINKTKKILYRFYYLRSSDFFPIKRYTPNFFYTKRHRMYKRVRSLILDQFNEIIKWHYSMNTIFNSKKRKKIAMLSPIRTNIIAHYLNEQKNIFTFCLNFKNRKKKSFSIFGLYNDSRIPKKNRY